MAKIVEGGLNGRGQLIWTMDDKFHRDGGPALIDRHTGHEEWYQHGVKHRDDGPAVTFKGELEEWYQHGVKHRDDGPAVIFYLGTAIKSQQWYQNGKCTRLDGPAVICDDGFYAWHINDEKIITPQRFQELTGCSDEELAALQQKYGEIKDMW